MISNDDIIASRSRILRYVYHTPLVYNAELSDRFACDLYFKAENFQRTGSFKIRGALSKVLTLSREEKKRGIITASSGNHALGVAFAAQVTGTCAVIVMPQNAREEKVSAVRAFGAEVIQYGSTPGERYEEVHRIIGETGCTLVHSCDDPFVIAGQGTVGLDIVEDMPDVSSVIVPLGAGALIGGIACAMKHHDSAVRVIGVEPENVSRFSASRKAGRPVDVPDNESIAEGLRMPQTFPSLYELAEAYVDEVVTVSEREIRESTVAMLNVGKMVAEPSGATGLAAVLSGTIVLPRKEKHVVVVTGGNMSLQSACELSEG